MEPVTVVPVQAVEVDASAGKAQLATPLRPKRRRKFIFGGLGLLIIAAGVAVAVFLVLKDGSNKVPISLKFVAVSGSESASRRDGAVSAAAVAVTVDELSYAIGTIKLCQEIQEEWYTWEGQEYVQYVPDHSTCVTIVDRGELRSEFSDSTEEQCTEAENLFDAEKYINFADQASLDSLSITEKVPLGSYKFAEVSFNRLLRVRASVDISNGTHSTTLYTKPCGSTTCGSVCNGEQNMRDCRGTITNPAEYKGTTYGERNSLGDVWAAAPFDSIAAHTNLAGTDESGYWRRCEHDMTVAPAEPIYTAPHNDQDSIVVQFLESLVVSANASLTLQLAVDISGLVGGQVKPFNSQVGGLGPTNFYGVSDGFVGFTLQSATMAPIILENSEQEVWRYEYAVYVRQSSVPYCMSGTEQFGKDGVPNGSGHCHPCHLFEMECRQGGTVVNDQEFATAGLHVEQAFDLRMNLFYQTGAGGERPGLQTPRSASVSRLYNSSLPVTLLLDEIFWAMRVEAIEQNTWDAKLSFWENYFGSGRFPRVRDFQPLEAAGQKGTAKVMVGAGGQQVYVEAVTELLQIVAQ